MSNQPTYNPPEGDHYYLLAPMALVHPTRWHEINPFSSDLTREEQYNATARLVIVGSVSGTLFFQHWAPIVAGGAALAALHYHWVVTTPLPPPPEKIVYSNNPLPFTDNVKPPPPEDTSIDSIYGVEQKRGDIKIKDTSIRNFRELMSTKDEDISKAPQRTARHFQTQMGRQQFPAVVGSAPAQ